MWTTPTRAPSAVGAPGTAQPYSASVFNISAMSFGSLGAHAIEALSAGAKKGGFYHDTGEGGVSRYHRKGGADLVWEIGSGLFRLPGKRMAVSIRAPAMSRPIPRSR
ncbi:MAG: glutamate synthase-related protein [Hyphomonas sp.]